MAHSPNIIVVNGHNFDRTSLVKSLQDVYGTRVTATDSATELLQTLHRTKQDVIVLLDIEAPLAKKGLFGISLVKNIVTDLNLGHVSVVSTSKTTNEQLMISSIESGAVDHLIFPLSTSTVKTLWLNSLKRQKLRSLESVGARNTHIVTHHTPINSWEYQNVVQLMNQYCSPLVDINLSAFPRVDPKNPAMLTKVQNWGFDAFILSEDECMGAIMTIFDDLRIFNHFTLDLDCLYRFLLAVRANYRNNPYHNFRHGVDVLQSFYYLLITSTVFDHLKHIEVMGLAVASLCHDLAHPGLNNFYQVNARTPLALLYNNKAVLENFHATATFCILMRPEFNFIHSFSQAEFKTFRDIVISSIMSTDMAVHFDFLNDMKRRYQEENSFSLEVKDDVRMMATSLVKCSDISNVTRPFEVCRKWADTLVEEFQAQGRLEQSSGLPIYPYGKQDLVMAMSQKEFISFVALPLFDLMAKLSDAFLPLLENLKSNLKIWTEKATEVRPASPESPRPKSDPKLSQALANRRKSLPAAQFILRFPTAVPSGLSVEIPPPVEEEESDSPEEEPLAPASPQQHKSSAPEALNVNGAKNTKQKSHRRSTSESGSHFYQSEDEPEETPWQPPVERVSALKTLDGGAEAIFKKRSSSTASRKDSE